MCARRHGEIVSRLTPQVASIRFCPRLIDDDLRVAGWVKTLGLADQKSRSTYPAKLKLLQYASTLNIVFS